MPWCVQDEAQEIALAASLKTLWQEAPIEIVRAEACPQGLSWEGEVLVLRQPHQTFRRDTHGSMSAAVAHARSWLRDLETLSGWVPTPDNQVVLKSATTAAVVTVEKPTPQAALPGFVTIGFENALIGSAPLTDFKLGGGYSTGLWSYELGLSVATRDPLALSAFESDLLARTLRTGTSPVSLQDMSTFGMGLTVHRYLSSLPTDTRLTPRMRVSAGLSAQRFANRFVNIGTANAEVSGRPIALQPNFGLGLDLHRGPRWALAMRTHTLLNYRRREADGSIRNTLSAEILYRR